MDNQKVIATLNNLLETTKDGARGFRTCAEGISNPRLSTVFEAAARRCDEGAGELEAKIHSLGGEPAASGTVGGSLHRAWTNIISSAIAPRGERNTLIVSLDALLRMSSNPFFPYMIERIEEGIRSGAAETPIKATTPP